MKTSMKTSLGCLLMIGVLVVILLVATVPGLFVKEAVAVRAAQIQGFTDIQVTGRYVVAVALRGCGQNDSVRFDVTAKNVRGERVQFYVCSGWLFKGATIRTR
jgi:hypothetical protein